MIPLRIMLENFMCYREKTEISFRGSTIWALSGHNGSGKSTIFDAMRYALYGEHRAGKQKVEALIHHSTTSAPSFAIEFDFAIGEDEYRVLRTYSQKKKGTTLALHLAGPNPPTPGRPSPQPIQGTEKEKEFERWVLKTIGLDERAFSVSVLLLHQQCKLAGGFPFRLLPLLHATAIKKLGRPTSIQRFRGRSLLISGGLYLALNLRHPDLEIREQLGDFAAGFSHEFGVGCTFLVASALFDIPPDALNPIAVDRRKKALDFAALRPDKQGLLLIEVKGVTSNPSRSTARRSIYGKKQDSGNTVVLADGRTLTSTQVTKIGVIVQAACKKSNRASQNSSIQLTETYAFLAFFMAVLRTDYLSEEKERVIESYLSARYHTHTVLAPPFCSTIKTINEQYISECTKVQTYVLLYYCCYGGFYVRQCGYATNILPAVS